MMDKNLLWCINQMFFQTEFANAAAQIVADPWK